MCVVFFFVFFLFFSFCWNVSMDTEFEYVCVCVCIIRSTMMIEIFADLGDMTLRLSVEEVAG